MTRLFDDVGSLQKQLKADIMTSIQNKLFEICEEVVHDSLLKNVYSYASSGNFPYDRTMDLFHSVTVDNLTIGTKYASFDVYMDSSKINAHITQPWEWNQHASVEEMDVSEYIPLWVEEGTEGSLWDREGAHYMEQAWIKLDDDLAGALARALRSLGWEVIEVS